MKKPPASSRPPSSSSSTTHTPSVPAAATTSRQTTNFPSLIMILRQRINEIGQELQRLKEETATLLRAKTKTHSYQRRLEALLHEVRSLEAVQADHNLALDKLRTSIDPAQLRLYLKNLRAQNIEAARGVNEHISQRQHLEQEHEQDPKQQQYQQQYEALQVELLRLESMRRYFEEEELPVVSLWVSDPKEAEARLLDKKEEDQQRMGEVEEQCRVLREGGREGGGLEAAGERARRELREAQRKVGLLMEYLRSNNNNNINSGESRREKREEQATDDLNPDADEEGGEEMRIELLRKRTKRLQELEKLRTMEEKIIVEIDALNQKAEYLKREMNVWAGRLVNGGGVEGGEGGEGGGEGRVLKEECLELVGRLNALLCEAGGADRMIGTR